MSEDSIVGIVSLSENMTLVFSIWKWHGKYFAGVRKCVKSRKYQGPTRSGITLGNKLLIKLVTILTRLDKTIPSQEECEFGTIPKSDTDNILIRTLPDEESGGLPWVDIREFIDTPTYQSFTKRGIRFRWDLLPDVLACLKEQAKVIGENEKNEPSLFGQGFFTESGQEPDTEDGGKSGETSLEEILGEVLKQFPNDFLNAEAGEGTQINLPELSLWMEQNSSGEYLLKTDDGAFIKVQNPIEADFIIYTQMRGHRETVLPKEMIRTFKAVKTYENYLRKIRSKLFAEILKKAHQGSVANYETDKLFRSLGLPKLCT